MKRKKLRQASGVTIRGLRYLFNRLPISLLWWESTENENYCAKCDQL